MESSAAISCCARSVTATATQDSSAEVSLLEGATAETSPYFVDPDDDSILDSETGESIVDSETGEDAEDEDEDEEEGEGSKIEGGDDFDREGEPTPVNTGGTRLHRVDTVANFERTVAVVPSLSLEGGVVTEGVRESCSDTKELLELCDVIGADPIAYAESCSVPATSPWPAARTPVPSSCVGQPIGRIDTMELLQYPFKTSLVRAADTSTGQKPGKYPRN